MKHSDRNKMKPIMFLVFFFILPHFLQSQELTWRQIKSCQEVINTYPQKINFLFQSLNLDLPQLQSVKRAWEQGNHVQACQALLNHYKQANDMQWVIKTSPAPDSSVIDKANNILNDIYYGFGDQGKVPRLENGHLDWKHKGPNDDWQFSLRINRHYQLGILLKAYQLTGKEKYLERINLDLLDWLTSSGGKPNPKTFGTTHLEPANRLPRWIEIFYALQNEQAFRPATKILMLASIPKHAEYLLENQGHGNWVTMTQLGSLICGIGWPEFTNSGKWREKALEQLQQNAQQTVYPDGVQKELTSTYHLVSAGRYQQTVDFIQKAGHKMPQEFGQIIEKMWNYTAQSLRPDGTVPLNNDSDLRNERERILNLAKKYNRPDWLYIATNGKKGSRPEDPPSRIFPWAGQLISRNGWKKGDHWSFFDIGPSGLGHRHMDFGHLSITAYGRDLLVDNGRFAYQGKISEKFRDPYARHTHSHNTILIDGKSQGSKPEVVEKPLRKGGNWQITKNYDFARHSWTDYENLEGKVTHTRATVYLRGKGWIVVDRVETDRPRKIRPLWHFHPTCQVGITGEQITTGNEKGNLRIKPVGNMDWNAEIIEGQENPYPQGWYSETYGKYEPAPCVQYTSTIKKTKTFAWVILPDKNQVPDFQATLTHADENAVTVKLKPKEEKQKIIQIPFKNGQVKIVDGK